MRRQPLHLAIYQFAPALCRPDDNARRIAAAAAEAGADLLLTPELSLTGYDVRDAAARLAVPAAEMAGVLGPAPADAPEVVVGLIERGAGGTPFNTAAHLRGSDVVFHHRKVYLPTYGMFDEARYFGRGARIDAYEPAAGWRAGILICEDFWHPALAYLLAVRGIELLLVQAAAPGRGAWDGGPDGARFASAESWERIARTTAELYGIYVALANRVGVEGGVSFGGGSLIVGPTGEVLARGSADGEVVIAAELDPAEVARARRPYAHARDEDPHFTRRELDRLLEASTVRG